MSTAAVPSVDRSYSISQTVVPNEKTIQSTEQRLRELFDKNKSRNWHYVIPVMKDQFASLQKEVQHRIDKYLPGKEFSFWHPSKTEEEIEKQYKCLNQMVDAFLTREFTNTTCTGIS